MEETNLIYPATRLADVVNSNPAILSVLERLGIKLGFHEATAEDICLRYGLSTHLFLDICNIYILSDYEPRANSLSTQDIIRLVGYLQTSHRYYSRKSLPALHRKIHRLLSSGNEANARILNKFYDDYLEEIKHHFRFEEDIVFPFVKHIAQGLSDSEGARFDISLFEENHTNIEDKLSDLKNTVLKYLPDDYPQSLRIDILKEIYAIAEDLEKHTQIEDKLLLPALQGMMGSQSCGSASPHSQTGEAPMEEPETEKEIKASDNRKDILSEREKDIVREVAKGLTNKEIADRLILSIHTVTTHRKNISRKTGINSISGLTVYAIINHIVDISDLK